MYKSRLLGVFDLGLPRNAVNAEPDRMADVPRFDHGLADRAVKGESHGDQRF
jgi:hypothetical protein